MTAEGGHFLVKLGGRVVLDYRDPAPLGRGYIGLQFNTGKIEFRNIKLKPLGMKRLLNGRDLAGWKTFPDLASVFTVTREGWLNVKNGRGMLESAGQYADFTLQLECFVNGKGLNSGVFFRCIPGDIMNGYECQIHNGYLGGDRTRPEDCGTGGFFRRQDARRVVADDFHLVLADAARRRPAHGRLGQRLPGERLSDTRSERESPPRAAAGGRHALIQARPDHGFQLPQPADCRNSAAVTRVGDRSPAPGQVAEPRHRPLN